MEDEQINRGEDGWMDGWMKERFDELTDGHRDGWMNGWMEERMVG